MMAHLHTSYESAELTRPPMETEPRLMRVHIGAALLISVCFFNLGVPGR